MNYLDIDFPEELSVCFSGGAEFATTISKLSNKQEICNQNWQNPRYKYKLEYKTCNEKVYEKLQTFFLICKGCGTAFNFLDVNDFKIDNQQIGIGDGNNCEFQIYKNYAYGSYSFKRQIFKVKNINVFLNNEKINDENFVINNGSLVFNKNAAPVKNSVITIDAVFYVIVRFENDFLPAIKKRQSFELPDLCLVETSLS